MSGSNTKWNSRRRSENGRRAAIETEMVAEEEKTKTMIGRDEGRRIRGAIEVTTGIEIVIEKGGGMMTAGMKRSAVAARRKSGGDANAMMTVMTASAQGAMRRTVTDDGIGVASIGGDDGLVQGAISHKVLHDIRGLRNMECRPKHMNLDSMYNPN